MRVLLTGAAGFIGSHLADLLLADGHDVTAIDNFDPVYPRAIKEHHIQAHRRHPRWRLLEADVRDLRRLRQVVTGEFDCIVHLAARGGVRPSIADPVGYQEVNVGGLQSVLELARERRVPQFVFASSSSVYGVDPRVPWSEDDAGLRPISPYASTKVSGELLGHVYSHLHGLRFIALRLFTVYGPRQRPDLAIHTFARLMLDGRPIPLYGDGSTRRDYTYIADIVDGIRRAMVYTGSSYEVINIGHGQTITLLEMVRGLEAALGRTAVIDWQPEQRGDVPQTWARIEKARALLGYEPRTSYADGIRLFAAWCLEQTTVA